VSVVVIPVANLRARLNFIERAADEFCGLTNRRGRPDAGAVEVAMVTSERNDLERWNEGRRPFPRCERGDVSTANICGTVRIEPRPCAMPSVV